LVSQGLGEEGGEGDLQVDDFSFLVLHDCEGKRIWELCEDWRCYGGLNGGMGKFMDASGELCSLRHVGHVRHG
jgi:hypothetical protein